MSKPPNTTGATANRFENDLVRPPQADCCAVSISLIIPHMDRGSLSVSVIDRASRSQMWVRYVLSGPLQILLQLSPMAEEIHDQPLHFELVYPQRRSASTGVVLSNPRSASPPGIQDESTGGSSGRTLSRKRHLSYLSYVVGQQGCLGWVWNVVICRCCCCCCCFSSFSTRDTFWLTPTEKL